MRDAAEFTALFTPFTLAGKRLRNRITLASMSLLATPAGRVTERLIQYHANRAAGGAAMTVTEPLGMMRHQSGLPRVQVWRRDDADGLKRFADAVETQDCRVLGQIQDAGRGRHFPGRNPEAIGASALPDDLSWTVPRPLTAAEIRDLIEQTAESESHLKDCGSPAWKSPLDTGICFTSSSRRDRTGAVMSMAAIGPDACASSPTWSRLCARCAARISSSD